MRIAVFKIILIPFPTIFIFDSFFQRMILAKMSAILHSQFQFSNEPKLTAHPSSCARRTVSRNGTHRIKNMPPLWKFILPRSTVMKELPK